MKKSKIILGLIMFVVVFICIVAVYRINDIKNITSKFISIEFFPNENVITKTDPPINQTISYSPNSSQQLAVNSPNSIQIQNKGGININVKPPSKPRKLVEKSKKMILDVIKQNPQKEILIKVVLGDQEANNYAIETKEFIESKTGKKVNMEWCIFEKSFKGQKIYDSIDKRIVLEIGSK
jgi:hypothetical protein